RAHAAADHDGGGDPFVHAQPADDSGSALFGEPLVVGVGAYRVRMADDVDVAAGLGPNHLRDLRQGVARVGANLGAVEVEQHVAAHSYADRIFRSVGTQFVQQAFGVGAA